MPFRTPGNVRSSRPAGNVTGLTNALDASFGEKRLELLKEAAPTLSRVAYLSDTGTTRAPEAAARTLRVTLVPITGRRSGRAPAGSRAHRAPAGRRHLRRSRSVPLVATGRDHRVRSATKATGHVPLRRVRPRRRLDVLRSELSHPASSRGELVRQDPQGREAGRLPIERPMKYELLVNVRTAKALGLPIPATILLQADQTLE